MHTDRMTTKRMSFQEKGLQAHSHCHIEHQNQHQHLQHHPHQQQRRPPDVEEALSSMLWTPYERASTTDSSSDEDDDEQVQRQLKKSKSQYDYKSVPTTMPPLTPPPQSLPLPLPPPPPTHLTPTNIVAYIAAAATPVRAVAATAVAATSLVTTTSGFYTAEDLCDPTATTPLVPFSNLLLNVHARPTTTATAQSHLEQTAATTEEDNDAVDDDDDDDDYEECQRMADDNEVILNAVDSFTDVCDNDNRLTAASSSMMMRMSSHQQKNRVTCSSSFGRIPSLTKWWSTSNSTSASTIEPRSVAAVTTSSQTISSSNPKDETDKQPPSYESLYKKHPSHPQRPRHRLNKHFNLFKPVLDTWKANVTTIAQGRFTSLTRMDHSTSRVAATIQTPTESFVGETEATRLTTDANSGTTGTRTSNNLIHSFTDNFLHEHCTNMRHVAVPYVDNEHIINNNKNNNNNNTTENINGETPVQQQALIHQPKYTHEQTQNGTNTKSKQNQENENKQNNNFIVCQQEQQKQLPLIYGERSLKEALITTDEEMNTNELTTDQQEIVEHNKMNKLKYTPPLKAATTPINTASLFYDSSSAISLTRSIETEASCTFGLTVVRDNFETDPQDTTRTTNTTYSLTPNKCLAELERLYAEFRASESLRERKLRESQNHLEATATEIMRLNVPASTSCSVGQTATDLNGEKSVSETARLNPSTSSVFLTTTNSLTTITNPCQRTPRLTIQVNQTSSSSSCSSKNNNNNPNDNNGPYENNESQMVLNQTTVNTTAHGVRVINCNYVNNSNNNNSNNNNNNNINKSITNLSDNATNTNNLVANTTATTYSVSNNHCSPNRLTSLNHLTPHINDNCNSDNIANNSQSLVPQVLKVRDGDESEIEKSYQKHLNNTLNTQVKVIQVNEAATKATNAPTSSSLPIATPSPQRTFTSTECQTDDVAAVQLRSPSTVRQPLASTSSANSGNTLSSSRDQRRRERRERRHLQHTASLLVAPTHTHPHPHIHPLRHAHLDRHSMPAPPLPPILHPPHLHPGLAGSLQQTGHNIAMLRPMLPDILHNHFPPPYSALPSHSMTASSGNVPHRNGSPIPFSHPHNHHPPPQTPTATILGPPPPPPPAGTTLLTSVISTVPIPGATPMVSDGRFTLPLPIMRRSPSERSGKGCCGQWFAGPPLRALIAVVAFGGVACALGGAALGATGLAGPPSSHFTAALLMIGVGVVLVTVSGAAWRMTAPGGPPCLGLGSSVDLGRCGRRPCSRGGGAPQGLLYPEFQHRPPPPSYQASMQEYRLRLLLLDRDRQNGVVRGSSPPPTYRSHAGSLLRAPLTSTARSGGGGNRCESSIGGSEYSFPPSYRSRNTTPGTISSERSIETEPSGRLLANEDIPEPLSVEQLSEYNSLQQRCNNPSNANGQKLEQKRNSIQLDTNTLIPKTDDNLNSLAGEKNADLVTIVTISPQSSEHLEASNDRANSDSAVVGTQPREQIEILAHL